MIFYLLIKPLNLKFIVSKDLKQLDIKFKIAPDYYLYKNKIDIKIDPILNFDLIKDNGKIKEDEFFGKQEVFYNDTTIKIIPKAPLSKTIPSYSSISRM